MKLLLIFALIVEISQCGHFNVRTPDSTSSCYLVASQSMFFGCGSQTSDLLSTASIQIQGGSKVNGNVVARSVSIGDCSEIDGDVISYSKIRKGNSVLIKGQTLSNAKNQDWLYIDAVNQIPTSPPFPPSSNAVLIIGNNQLQAVDSDDSFQMILVQTGGNLNLPEGTIFTNTLIVEDGATITGSTYGSTIWALGDITIGSDVVIEGKLSLYSKSNIKLGKRICGSAQAIEKRNLHMLEAVNCDCDVPDESDRYCDDFALVDLFAFGTVNIGSDSGIKGAILANNVIGGSGVFTQCSNSPYVLPPDACVDANIINSGFSVTLGTGWIFSPSATYFPDRAQIDQVGTISQDNIAVTPNKEYTCKIVARKADPVLGTLTATFDSTTILNDVTENFYVEYTGTATPTTNSVTITFSGKKADIKSISCVCTDNLDPE